MQVFNAESRWKLFTHLDLAVFADAGKVAPVARDLDLTRLKTSYGVGFRLRQSLVWTSDTVTRAGDSSSRSTTP
jgi:hypothetical protein